MKAWRDAKGVRAEESRQRACLPLSRMDPSATLGMTVRGVVGSRWSVVRGALDAGASIEMLAVSINC